MTGPNSRRNEAAKAARTRAGGGPVVALPLEPGEARPLYRQVYDGLREAILAGRLRPGERLPSTRTLAAELGVARNTVVLAYEQLRTEGYVVGARGGGTRVREALPDALLHVRPGPRRAAGPARARAAAPGKGEAGASATGGARPAPPAGDAGSARQGGGARLSARGAMLAAAGAGLAQAGRTEPVPFRLGVPALDVFPRRLWARLTARDWRRGGPYLGDADAGGERALREAIAWYVTHSRGARCTADQVFVVSGTQQGLDIAARVLLDPGDAVWVEDPGYPYAHTVLAVAGARLVPVTVDDEGLDVAAGERAAPTARLAYVTPSHQFPLGAVMSVSRRLMLLAWARRAEAWVVEDDYDSEFRYAGRPLPCLQGLDAERQDAAGPARVLYIGTFSKTLAPALRLGYLIVPDALVDAFRAARAVLDRHAPTLAQGVLADFIAGGHYARHVRRMRTLYAERQAALLAAAEAELEGLLTLTPDPAGLHVVGRLAPGLDAEAAAAAAEAEGVRVYPVSRYALSPDAQDRSGLILGYAGFDVRAIRVGVRKLRRALESLRA